MSEKPWAEPAEVREIETVPPQPEIIYKSSTGNIGRKPCPDILGEHPPRHVIPGLDASLCRCPNCKAIAPRGIWWVDQQMRDQLMSRRKGQPIQDNDL